MMSGPGAEGVLVFEKPGGGSDEVPASKVAAVLKDARVPVVVMNACQSGAVGKDVEAAVATRLLREGAAAVVAMAYTVYAVAAAEFMAVFYKRLFAGDTVSAAVTAGRRRLFEKDGRPSPKGDLPLADWLVPVHYLRRDVSFPQAQTSRPAAEPSLEALLDDLRTTGEERNGGTEGLDPVGVFVGRDDLFYQLETAARLQRVVVLHGQAGTGKTELVKAFGRWWRDTGGTDKPEWVLWHSFEPGVASFGLDGVITEAGLRIFGPDFARRDTARRSQEVEELLAQQKLMLIWDNFETVRSMPGPAEATPPLEEAECAKVKGFLARLAADGRSVVVITSRTAEDWLGPVRRIEVGGLAPEEATQYAGELLAPYPAAAPRQAQRAFGELLEWLDGHPLSMRLILPHLDATEPEALLEGLRGTTPLPGDDAGGDRAMSLAASITYSFTHLTSSTRRLLPAVCLFRGVADANVLALFSRAPGVPGRFAGASGQDWISALDDAARVGLLTPLSAGMYRVHPVLPTYLAGRWRAEDPESYGRMRDAATRALVTAHATLGSWLHKWIGSGNASFAHTLIGLQQRTLGAMLGYALDHQMWQEAATIALPLDHYWIARGLDEEASAWTGRVQLATENPDGSPPRLDTPAGDLWVFITGEQANRHQQAMRLDEAERVYRQMLDMFQAQPASPRQQGLIGTACHQLGIVTQLRGHLEDAEEWYRKSLAIKQNLGDQPGIATSYHQLGMIAQHQGRRDDAKDWYRKSLAIEKARGNQPGMATSYHQLGLLAQDRGRLDDAEDWYRKSLAISEALGNRPSMATSYHQLGLLAQRQGRLDDAKDWYRKSLAISEDLRDKPQIATSYHQLGMVAQDRAQLDDAEDWYRKSLAISEDFRDKPSMAASYGQLGLLAEQRGQPIQALEWTVKCVTMFEEFPHPLTGSGARQLAHLTAQLGIGALEASWLEITSRPLPQAVRDHVSSSQPKTSEQQRGS